MCEQTKKCSKCGEVKARTEEFFRPQKTGRSGFRADCRDCEKLYRDRNRDVLNKSSAERYRRNSEKIKARQKKWREANKDKIATRNAIWYRGNIEKHRSDRRSHYSRNKEMYNAAEKRRRAAKLGCKGDHTAEQLKARFDYHGNKCVYCNSTENLHADHQIPLSRGGTNFASNMVPACESCNKSKGSKKPEEFLVYQFNIAMEKLING